MTSAFELLKARPSALALFRSATNVNSDASGISEFLLRRVPAHFVDSRSRALRHIAFPRTSSRRVPAHFVFCPPLFFFYAMLVWAPSDCGVSLPCRHTIFRAMPRLGVVRSRRLLVVPTRDLFARCPVWAPNDHVISSWQQHTIFRASPRLGIVRSRRPFVVSSHDLIRAMPRLGVVRSRRLFVVSSQQPHSRSCSRSRTSPQSYVG